VHNDWSDILASANLGLLPLYPHNVGKRSGYVLACGFEANIFFRPSGEISRHQTS
jgi:hypothetical protein